MAPRRTPCDIEQRSHGATTDPLRRVAPPHGSASGSISAGTQRGNARELGEREVGQHRRRKLRPDAPIARGRIQDPRVQMLDRAPDRGVHRLE
jgi:hypothetical protein